MSQETPVVNDPFLDDDVQLDLRNSPEPLGGLNTNDILNPEIVTNVEGLEQPEEIQATPEPSKEEPQPEITEYEDGSSVVIQKTGKGWEAKLDTGTGAQPEVFYGATKAELLNNVLVAKMHATRKIRDLNRKVKLGIGNVPVQTLEATPAPAVPSANDTFDVKAKFEDDPIEAFDLAFQKKTGKTMSQVARDAERGAAAEAELYREQVGRDFTTNNPDYVKVHDNYVAILGYLAKYKLGVPLNPDTFSDQGQLIARGNEDQILAALVNKNLYTVHNLSEAWDNIKEENMAVFGQPEVEVPKPAPKPRVQPRAGLGIRTATTTPVVAPPVANKKFEDMTDEEIATELAKVRQLKLANPVEFARLKEQGQVRR